MPEPSAVRRQLGKELAAIRRITGDNQRALADRIGTSQSTVTRIERGERLPDSSAVVQAWLRVCRPRAGYPAGVADRIRALYRAAAGETRPWTELLEGHPHLQDIAQERNAAAAAAYNVQTVLLPGLVQTEAYARRALSAVAAANGLPPGDLDAEVVARMARQSVLMEPGRRFEFIVAERLLESVPGPPDPVVPDWDRITKPQLEHLAEVAALGTVRLAILPDAAGDVIWHPFILREPADGSSPYVTIELIHGEQELREPRDIAIYRGLWTQLWAAAWKGADAVARIRSLLSA